MNRTDVRRPDVRRSRIRHSDARRVLACVCGVAGAVGSLSFPAMGGPLVPGDTVYFTAPRQFEAITIPGDPPIVVAGDEVAPVRLSAVDGPGALTTIALNDPATVSVFGATQSPDGRFSLVSIDEVETGIEVNLRTFDDDGAPEFPRFVVRSFEGVIDGTGLPGDSVWAPDNSLLVTRPRLAQVAEGWEPIAVGGAILRFAPGEFDPTLVAELDPVNFRGIMGLSIGPDGSIWFGGVTAVSPAVVRLFQIPPSVGGVPSDPIDHGVVIDTSNGVIDILRWRFDLAVDAAGKVWFARPAVFQIAPEVELIDDAMLLRFDPETNQVETIFRANGIIGAFDGIVAAPDGGVYTAMKLSELDLMLELVSVTGNSAPASTGIFFDSTDTLFFFSARDIDLATRPYAAIKVAARRCPGDVDASGEVDFNDLVGLLNDFGPCGGFCIADLNDDGAVTFADLVLLLNNVGPCD